MKSNLQNKSNYSLKGKIVYLIACIVLIIFLMLPFIFNVDLIRDWRSSISILVIIYLLFNVMFLFIKSTSWYRKKLSSFIVNYSNVKNGDKVLEVGCHDGLYSIKFAKKIFKGEIWGVDQWKKNDVSKEIPKDILENARIEGVENIVSFQNVDLKKLPFSDNYFDLVCSFNVLHNIHPDRKKILLEMIRVLKPKGSLVIVGRIIKMLNYNILPLINIHFENFYRTRVLIAEKS